MQMKYARLEQQPPKQKDSRSSAGIAIQKEGIAIQLECCAPSIDPSVTCLPGCLAKIARLGLAACLEVCVLV